MSNVNPIIDRVKKLLALAASPNNAAEAANAARIANQLIDQYRISEAELENNVDAVIEPFEDDLEPVYMTGKVQPWKERLVQVISKHYGCAYWLSYSYPEGRRITSYRLCGKRNDLAIVKYMYAWLLLECQRLSDREAKGQGRIYVASYCMGFVIGIKDQLALSRSEVQKTATSTAMVLIDSRFEEASNALSDLHPELRMIKSKSASRYNGTAFSQGQDRGKAIHLGTSLSSGGGTRMLNK